MQKKHFFIVTSLAIFAITGYVLAQGGEIVSIDFDSIPEGTRIASSAITLDGEVQVNGGLNTDGVISTTGGVMFPDGTIQLTAAQSTASSASSTNSGLYDNRIQNVVPPNPYTEVCFKNRSVSTDVHIISETTVGGSCEPGDVGWIIEHDDRGSAAWDEAKVDCLLDGMRLPEAFELRFSCRNAVAFAINDLPGNDEEWASNTAWIGDTGTRQGPAAPNYGQGSCNQGNYSFLAATDGTSTAQRYRCAL